MTQVNTTPGGGFAHRAPSRSDPLPPPAGHRTRPPELAVGPPAAERRGAGGRQAVRVAWASRSWLT